VRERKRGRDRQGRIERDKEKIRKKKERKGRRKNADRKMFKLRKNSESLSVLVSPR